jgi:hypothetical protein
MQWHQQTGLKEGTGMNEKKNRRKPTEVLHQLFPEKLEKGNLLF